MPINQIAIESHAGIRQFHEEINIAAPQVIIDPRTKEANSGFFPANSLTMERMAVTCSGVKRMRSLIPLLGSS